MEVTTKQFKHRRTPAEVDQYMQLQRESSRETITYEQFPGTAHCCGDVGGGVTIVKLYDGEQIYVLVSNSDQSGAETAILLKCEVDDAKITMVGVGGGQHPISRLLKILPVEAQEAINDWYVRGE